MTNLQSCAFSWCRPNTIHHEVAGAIFLHNTILRSSLLPCLLCAVAANATGKFVRDPFLQRWDGPSPDVALRESGNLRVRFAIKGCCSRQGIRCVTKGATR